MKYIDEGNESIDGIDRVEDVVIESKPERIQEPERITQDNEFEELEQSIQEGVQEKRTQSEGRGRPIAPKRPSNPYDDPHWADKPIIVQPRIKKSTSIILLSILGVILFFALINTFWFNYTLSDKDFAGNVTIISNPNINVDTPDVNFTTPINNNFTIINEIAIDNETINEIIDSISERVIEELNMSG